MKDINSRHVEIEVALISCKQTAQLHLTGMVMVFKRMSEASEGTIFVVKCARNVLKSNIYRMCSEIRLLIPKPEQFSAINCRVFFTGGGGAL